MCACGFVPAYIYAWILKLFDTDVVLEEERLKVKVTLKGHINKLVRVITPTFVHDFKIILHRCSLGEEVVPFETFDWVG